jgi:hypothetical protein
VQAARCGLTCLTLCNMSFPGRVRMNLLPLKSLVALRAYQGTTIQHVQVGRRGLAGLGCAVWAARAVGPADATRGGVESALPVAGE